MRLFNFKNQKTKRRSLRKRATNAEKILWQELRRKNLGFKFRRQFGVGPYIIDFYCPQLKFGIELDGDVHAFDLSQEHDKSRQKFLENNGLYIKRYWNHEVFNNLDYVLEDIYNTCIELSVLSQKVETGICEFQSKLRGRLQRGLW